MGSFWMAGLCGAAIFRRHLILGIWPLPLWVHFCCYYYWSSSKVSFWNGQADCAYQCKLWCGIYYILEFTTILHIGLAVYEKVNSDLGLGGVFQRVTPLSSIAQNWLSRSWIWQKKWRWSNFPRESKNCISLNIYKSGVIHWSKYRIQLTSHYP